MIEDARKKFQLTLIYLFAAMIVFGITPFAIMRYLNGEYLKAGLDVAIIIIAATNASYAYLTKSVFYPSILGAIQYSLATTVIIYMNTPLYFFWVFPAFSANFFLLRPIYAIALNLAIAAAMIPICLQIDDPIARLGMLMSMIFTGSMIYVFAREANKHHELLQTYAAQDPLTLLGNRRAMNLEMSRCIEDLKRHGTQASVIVLDLDHFKLVNDNFGHKCGDEVLIQTADLLRQRIRKTDRVFRFGGEEFVVLARNTQLDAAQKLAEKLRTEIAQHISSAKLGTITTSLGCAALHLEETADQWFEQADKAMYQAKDLGRNQVVLADQESLTPDNAVKV